ncbi:MAG: hypothetical protein SGCHY_002485, partial [Lobulomycetales sp.]
MTGNPERQMQRLLLVQNLLGSLYKVMAMQQVAPQPMAAGKFSFALSQFEQNAQDAARARAKRKQMMKNAGLSNKQRSSSGKQRVPKPLLDFSNDTLPVVVTGPDNSIIVV